jgi:hypothetical protein
VCVQGVFTTKDGVDVDQEWTDGEHNDHANPLMVHEVPVPLFESEANFITRTIQCMVGIGNFGHSVAHPEL